MKNKRITLISVLMLVMTGCVVSRAPVPIADYYYLNPDASLASIGKVALVPLKNMSVYPQIAPDVTKALFEEIQKRQRFSLKVVPPDDTAWKSLQLDLDSKYEPGQLPLAAKTLNCDAIMTGTITEYTPYPHLALGLRLKIIRCSDGQLLWAFEQIWDTADKKTENRIKKYISKNTRSSYESLNEQLVSLSSIKFTKFVANEVASTF
ncbi:MAG: hypothetical protein JW804_06425 [Sedimentisphaerales bacterium]|nr:hypothetical protein [Sedimentisphaerales bacterium]